MKNEGAWKTVPEGRIPSNSDWIIPVLLDEPVKARWLRLVFKDDDFNRVYEVAVSKVNRGSPNKRLPLSSPEGVPRSGHRARLV